MKTDTAIACLDLKDQHQFLRDEMFEAFERVYDRTAFSGGPFVQEFESRFSEYIGTNYAIAVSNGTVSLHLAMLALGIGPNDEVIVPANTFIATAWGVSHAGATPVFVDCDDTWQIDPLQIENAITEKTKAIVGVHLYGQTFDVDAVQAVCDQYGLFLIEDAAQAHGALYKGKSVGTLGELACFSFYPGKNLGACGEGGGLTTGNREYLKRLQSLRNHGSTERYFHDEIGFNYRMGGLEAASLTVKLKYIDAWNEMRKSIAEKYNEGIRNEKIRLPVIPDYSGGVYHLYVVTVEDRPAFVEHLAANRIAAAYHYPVPCHLQKAYDHLNYEVGDFPNAEYLANHCVSLPMYPELTDSQIAHVIDCVNRY